MANSLLLSFTDIYTPVLFVQPGLYLFCYVVRMNSLIHKDPQQETTCSHEDRQTESASEIQ
jgi:hypothetical protein